MQGTTLSHYALLEKLGSGGMGVVYRARDERLGRVVALKVLPAATLSDPHARAQFRREALALSRLNHPNIATVHDFDSDEGVDFLVMECVEGETLAAKLEGGAIPEHEAVAIALQIAEALEEAHERGVIHRDLKPGNVIVTGKGRVKVLDFGLAKLLRPGEGGETVSVGGAGTWSGTLPYMAPEQLEGQPVDARVDLYGLGAILYEMVSGRRAFAASSGARLLHMILNEHPPGLSASGIPVSHALEALIFRLLDRNPSLRPPSAAAVAAELRPLARAATAAPSAASASRGARPIQGLVVLPLENLSGDPEQEYFADGMTEELIADLAQIQSLRVISRTSAMRYKRTPKTLQEIGRELKVDAVVEGSVRRHGDRVRITAQLIEVASDRHLWAKSYERDLRDVLALQGEVAQAIAHEIRGKLTPEEEARFARAHTVDPRAYEAYLKGRHHWNKRTDESLLKSLEYFREAIDRDPLWSTGFLGLAEAYNVIGFYGALPPADSFPKAKAAALKSLQIDASAGEAHAAVGYVEHYYEWNWEAAERSFRRALELNEAYAYSHLYYANFLVAMGRREEAYREIDRALELDPLSMIASTARGWARTLLGEPEKAVAFYQKTLELEPGFFPAHVWMAYTYDVRGMLPEALAELRKAEQTAPEAPWVVATLARVLGRMGRPDEAEAELRKLIELARRRYVSPYDSAITYSGLGRTEEAMAELERAYAGRANMLVLLRVDPRLDAIRSDPRFADLERRMAFP